MNPGGFLFLGTSETVGDFADSFGRVGSQGEALSAQGGRSSTDAAAAGQASCRQSARAPGRPGAPPRDRRRARPAATLRELTERALLEQYAPVGALVDERGEILYLHGRTGQYLEPAPGEAGLNILKMAREGLRHELTAALHKAVAHAGAGAPAGACG